MIFWKILQQKESLHACVKKYTNTLVIVNSQRVICHLTAKFLFYFCWYSCIASWSYRVFIYNIIFCVNSSWNSTGYNLYWLDVPLFVLSCLKIWLLPVLRCCFSSNKFTKSPILDRVIFALRYNFWHTQRDGTYSVLQQFQKGFNRLSICLT